MNPIYILFRLNGKTLKNLIKINVIVSLFLISIQCRGDWGRPEGVPEDAVYNRKLNLYTHKIDGYEYRWFENGKLIAKVKLNEVGLNEGPIETYDYNTGVVISRGTYKMSEKSGKWEWAFSDGKPYYEMNFSPGVRKRKFWYPTIEWGNENGPYFRYFPNGRVSEKGMYDGGNRSGDWVKYYPDTKIESKGSYAEDLKVGEWFYYYPDGRKESMEKYNDKGELIFRQTYYPNGSLWCETKQTQTPICN
jgi:antitoxin component YwqK of YwqJK toxin-antitoxin module